MKHEMPHDLSPELAKRAAERAFASYKAKYSEYNPTLTWVSDDRAKASFTAKGITLNGAIELLPKAITFDLDVPFLLRPFKKTAMTIMDRELTHWIAKAKAGELD